jgi:hypothetical protein
MANAVQENNCCLFWKSHETHTHTAWEKWEPFLRWSRRYTKWPLWSKEKSNIICACEVHTSQWKCTRYTNIIRCNSFIIPSRFQTRMFCAFLITIMRATRLTHLTLLDAIPILKLLIVQDQHNWSLQFRKLNVKQAGKIMHPEFQISH